MKTRILTGVFITAVYLSMGILSALVSLAFFEAMTVIFMLVASLEVSKAVSSKFEKPLNGILIFTVLGGFTAYALAKYVLELNGLTAFFIFLVASFVVLFFVKFAYKEIDINNAMSTMFVMVYPIGIMSFMLGLGSLYEPYAKYAIGLLLINSTFTDTMAYFIGVWLRGPKLAPHISPKKSISGAIGGLFGGVLGATIMFLMAEFNVLTLTHFADTLALRIAFIFILGLCGSVMTQLGDLVASYIKRACDIKDFGHFLPGHGGIMDRLDGTIITAIFIYLFFSIYQLVVL